MFLLPFFHGIGAGLVLIVSLGPAFFTILKTSVNFGFKSAIPLVLGIFTSDVLYAYLVLAGLSSLIDDNLEVRRALSFTGAIILLAYGLYTLYTAKNKTAEDSNVNDLKPVSSKWLLYIKGFLINGVNPFMIIFWIGITSITTVNLEYTYTQQLQFITGVLLTMLSLDLTKAFFANKIRHLATPKILFRFNIVMGIILIGFSVRLFYAFLTTPHG